MITVEGAARRLCGGLTRRDLLRAGTAGIAGLTLADLLRLRAEASPTRGRARSIIMIHLSGGPSHVDTYDPKPEAAVEIRGEFKAISTNVDGIQIGELFPLQARIMDRLALVRSVARVLPEEHASSLMCTGYGFQERRVQGDHPSVGAVLTHLRADAQPAIPPYVSLRGVDYESGLGAAFLGGGCEPLNASGPGRDDLKLRVTDPRHHGRRRLLERLDAFRRQVDHRGVENQDVFSRRALEIISSTATYDAMDVSKEPKKLRESYGNDHFLLARRLVEAGVRCVAIQSGGWDTHEQNFRSLRDLMPRLDRAFSTLMEDLRQRGLEQETVVVMWGEFGRTPKVNGSAGRDHWPQVMSAVLAGGGLRTGQVVGATSANAYEAVETPVRVRSVVATLYHALGIDPHTTLTDHLSRPIPIVPDEGPIPALIG